MRKSHGRTGKRPEMMEPLEQRVLLAAGPIFSTNSVRRLYSEPIGGDASGSRVVRYKNVTSKSVTIPSGGVVISGAHASQYKIINHFDLPRGLRPGASIKFSIVFDPKSSESAGIKTGLLTVLTTTGASKSVRLRGIATTGVGGAHEPSLQRLFDLYQMPIRTGDSDPATGSLDPQQPNDETFVQKMVKAGPGLVTAYPIAAYIPVTNPSLRFGYYTAGNAAARTQLFTLADTDAQSVNPNATGSITFDPGSATFGFYNTIPSVKNADNSERTAFTEDALNTWDADPTTRRKARFYPLKSKDGTVTPNAYVVGFEDLDADPDFQDGVFVITNVKPG
ncbi:MAG TPA: hypothetical protein VER17_19455 [Tepidisphaeraceae bacterium]|nr:hypothetical protein [Tepidisphaeraceae bacterium]